MKKFLLIVVFLAGLLAGCAPDSAVPPSSALTAWVDAPLDEATLPLAPYEIVAHASDPDQIQYLEISVDGEVLGQVENPDPANLLLSASINWTPPGPGVYTIEARGQNGDGEWSSPARVRVTVEEQLVSEPTLELLPTAEVSLELADCPPEITALMDTTCRQGPTTYNEPAAYLLEGDRAPLLGGNQDLSWWAVQPESLNEPCWVSGSTVETSCPPLEPELIEAPPYITWVFPTYEEFYWGDHPRRSVTIQAQSGGEIPVSGVRLYYHLAGKSDWYNSAMILGEGNLWQAQIQAHTFKNYREVRSALVEYYLEATNEAGLVTKSPNFSNLKLKPDP